MARAKKSAPTAAVVTAATAVSFDDLTSDLPLVDDAPTAESLAALVDKFQADGGKIEVIPEGVTAAAHALHKALSLQKLCFDEHSEELFQNALDEAAKYKDEILVEFAQLGPQGFVDGVISLVEEGLFIEAYRPIKNVIRQMVRDLYYRYARIAREQQRQMGFRSTADAPDINVAEFHRRNDYPGLDKEALTPAEQMKVIEEVHDQLSFLYIELQKFQREISGWVDMQITPLPMFWYMDDDSTYHEIMDIDSAFYELDRQAAVRKEKSIAQKRQGLAALRSLRIATAAKVA